MTQKTSPADLVTKSFRVFSNTVSSARRPDWRRVSACLILAIVAAVAFGFLGGAAAAKRFGACYLKSMSVDHILVFWLVFRHFNVPASSQARVLFWGAIVNIALRVKLIALNIALIEAFHWMVYIYGAVLILLGFNVIKRRRELPLRDVAELFSVRIVRRLLPVADYYKGDSFVVRSNGRLRGTPLLLALLTLELCDIMFALDEIPAMLAVTRDAAVIIAANLTAALTLRALYLAVAPSALVLTPMRTAAGLLLVFAGLKFLAKGFVVVPDLLSLAVIVFVTAAVGLWSWRCVSQPGENRARESCYD